MKFHLRHISRIKTEPLLKRSSKPEMPRGDTQPEIPQGDNEKSGTCTDKEEHVTAAATVLSLPMCMPSLSSGVDSIPGSQAIASMLGRFTDNGSLCRCI